MATTTIRTPAGPFSLVARGSAVLAAGFTTNIDELVDLIHPTLRDDVEEDADLDAIMASTQAYFDGDLTAIDTVKVEQHPGGYLGHVWETLRDVPPGTPMTYTELAARAGRPAAIRGAAQACARNAVALFVPCHRIVRIGGGLGGYRWGLDVKRWLLTHEHRDTSTD